MWQKIRWIFPVIFAGIIICKIYGHFAVPPRKMLRTDIPDPNTRVPYAFSSGPTLTEPPVDKTDEPGEIEETEDPPRSHLPIILVVSAVGITAGFFGMRRVWGRLLQGS